MLPVSYIKTVILLCYEVRYLFPSCASDVFLTDSAVCLENVLIFEIYRADTQSPVLTPTARGNTYQRSGSGFSCSGDVVLSRIEN